MKDESISMEDMAGEITDHAIQAWRLKEEMATQKEVSTVNVLDGLIVSTASRRGRGGSHV